MSLVLVRTHNHHDHALKHLDLPKIVRNYITEHIGENRILNTQLINTLRSIININLRILNDYYLSIPKDKNGGKSDINLSSFKHWREPIVAYKKELDLIQKLINEYNDLQQDSQQVYIRYEI